MLIFIECWDYLLTREPDRQFRIWHNVTPEDGGYGTAVNVLLPADYFQKHSVKKFYEHIAQQQNCRPAAQSVNKHQQIENLTEQLRKAGWLD